MPQYYDSRTSKLFLGIRVSVHCWHRLTTFVRKCVNGSDLVECVIAIRWQVALIYIYVFTRYRCIFRHSDSGTHEPFRPRWPGRWCRRGSAGRRQPRSTSVDQHTGAFIHQVFEVSGSHIIMFGISRGHMCMNQKKIHIAWSPRATHPGDTTYRGTHPGDTR